MRVQTIRGRVLMGVDTTSVSKAMRKREEELVMVLDQSGAHGARVSLRSMRDAREEVDRLGTGMDRLMSGLEDELDRFSGYRRELVAVMAPQRDSLGEDSVQVLLYAREARVLQALAKRTMLACDSVLNGVLELHERGLGFKVMANAENDRLAKAIVDEEASMGARRYPVLWRANDLSMPTLGTVVAASWRTVSASMRSFARHFWKQLVVFRVLLLVLALVPLWYVRRVLRPKDGTPYSGGIRLLRDHPAEVATIAVLVLAPLLFTHTPRVVYDLFFIGLLFPVVWSLLRQYRTLSTWRMFALLGFYIVLKASNLLVETTLFKRLLLACAIGAVPLLLYGLRFLLKAGFRFPRMATALVGLLAFQVAVGWLIAVLGWHRLGGNLITVGLDAFYLAIALHIAVHASFEYLLLLADHLHRTGRRVAVNILKARPRIMHIQVVLAVLLWTYSYLNGMDLWELLHERTVYQLSEQRQLFGITFSWSSAVVFLICVSVTITLSRLLSDLFDMDGADETRGHGGMLLLRLVVIFGGFLLAIVAAGIPMHRMIVVLGALGVGIGFGLQNLMNNLISGIMLAVEHPVRPGDLITVKDGTGTVMDVGIRSTRLMDRSGSVLIVPNAQLISDTVSNLTLNDRTGQVTLRLAVPAANDITRVLAIAQEVADAQVEDGLRRPAVRLLELGHYWLEIEVSFWVREVRTASARRSEVLTQAVAAFQAQGITLGDPSKDPH